METIFLFVLNIFLVNSDKISKSSNLKLDDLNILSELTKNIFNTKRKMVSKALKKILNEKELQIIDFNNIKNLRAENLDFNFYYKLVDLIKSRS